MSEHSPSPNPRSLSPRSPRRGRSYSPRSTKSSRSRSYSRSRSRSYRSRSRSGSPYRRSYRRYYSRSPHPRRSSPPPPPPPSRRYRSRSPPLRRKPVNKDCRVYVSNLPFETTWHHLKDFMREAGQVAHVDILKLPNGRSKGCGVVEYRYPEDAKRAIHIMNNVEFMGRPVYIREDREQEFSGPPKDLREAPEECRLLVSNLPLTASWQDIKDLFRRAGRVLHTDVHSDPRSRRPNGFGTVIFDEVRFARNAIEMFNGHEWQGHKLEVKEGRYNERLVARPTIKQIPLEAPVTLQHDIVETIVKDETPIKVEPIVPYYNRYTPPHIVPPPPIYSNTPTFVGGPAANLPTHGHNQIYVNNLPFSTTWQDLIDLFRHVGPVIRSEILIVNGHPKGCGLVRFEDASTCERAIEKFNGYMYGGRQLDIRLDKYSTTI